MSRTQALAEVIHCFQNEQSGYKLCDQIIISMQCGFQTKLAMLEQKLLKEEHERQLVQEKADQVRGIHIYTLLLFNFPYPNIYIEYR